MSLIEPPELTLSTLIVQREGACGFIINRGQGSDEVLLCSVKRQVADEEEEIKGEAEECETGFFDSVLKIAAYNLTQNGRAQQHLAVREKGKRLFFLPVSLLACCYYVTDYSPHILASYEGCCVTSSWHH
jgi:hypothetical protein